MNACGFMFPFSHCSLVSLRSLLELALLNKLQIKCPGQTLVLGTAELLGVGRGLRVDMEGVEKASHTRKFGWASREGALGSVAKFQMLV